MFRSKKMERDKHFFDFLTHFSVFGVKNATGSTILGDEMRGFMNGPQIDHYVWWDFWGHQIRDKKNINITWQTFPFWIQLDFAREKYKRMHFIGYAHNRNDQMIYGFADRPLDIDSDLKIHEVNPWKPSQDEILWVREDRLRAQVFVEAGRIPQNYFFEHGFVHCTGPSQRQPEPVVPTQEGQHGDDPFGLRSCTENTENTQETY